MDRRHFLRTAGGSTLAALTAHSAAAGEGNRPNVLLIVGDDCTWTDLPLYGGTNVETPHIDRLAGQGLTFNRAYVSMSMCQPCRSELYTGLYPVRNGCCWNHSACRPGTESIAHHLGERGYRVGIAGKVHAKPRRSFPFERVPGIEGNCVSQTARLQTDGLREFMARDDGQPFCLAACLVVPHIPWSVGAPGQFDPEALDLPPYLADTPRTRSEYARYLAEVEVMDRQVGRILQVLQETGHADDTLVLFTSEQGAQFPGCKWTVWEDGIHTALVARWPGVVPADRRTDALVQYADVPPTLLEAAGGDPTNRDYDGSSFLPVLRGETDRHRRYAYAMHNNVPEGPPYPSRSVHDGTYHYIRNLRPERTYVNKWIMGKPEHSSCWQTWNFSAVKDPHTYRLIHRYMNRPAEQLYNTKKDTHEMTNLADDAAHQDVKKRLSDELDRWMESQGDPGAGLDTREALRRRRREARRYQEKGNT